MLADLPKGAMLLADKGYDANPLRAAVSTQDAWANIPPKTNRKDPICVNYPIGAGDQRGPLNDGCKRNLDLLSLAWGGACSSRLKQLKRGQARAPRSRHPGV